VWLEVRDGPGQVCTVCSYPTAFVVVVENPCPNDIATPFFDECLFTEWDFLFPDGTALSAFGSCGGYTSSGVYPSPIIAPANGRVEWARFWPWMRDPGMWTVSVGAEPYGWLTTTFELL
jgi:hypothetical protein